MDKHSKKSSSLLHYPVLVVFSLFFLGLFALDLITPDRAYSEMENTTLSQRPALTQLSAKGLNSYFTAYTKYVKDQVFGRDEWISLQSVVLRNQLKQAYLAFLIFAQRNQTCQRHPENCALHCPLIPKYQFAKLYQITLTNISISHIL